MGLVGAALPVLVGAASAASSSAGLPDALPTVSNEKLAAKAAPTCCEGRERAASGGRSIFVTIDRLEHAVALFQRLVRQRREFDFRRRHLRVRQAVQQVADQGQAAALLVVEID